VGGGFLFRSADAELLVRPFCHRDAGPGLLLLHGPRRAQLTAPLSAREQEVLDWMAEGKTNAEIGTILGISLHTVKRHVEKVLLKLGAPNRSAAVAARIGPRTYPALGTEDLICPSQRPALVD
jgi:DNA-binding CsgD family transcriptional regulator